MLPTWISQVRPRSVHAHSAAPTDPLYDYAPVAQRLLDAGEALYFDGARTYHLDVALDVGSRSTILADPQAVIRRFNAADGPLIRTTNGPRQVRIWGGRWHTATHLWEHTGGSQPSAWRISDAFLGPLDTAGVDIEKGVDIVVEDCLFSQVPTCVILGSDNGQVAGCRLVNLRAELADRLLHLRGTAELHVDTAVVGCIVDNTDQLILVDGAVRGLLVESCFFEPGAASVSPSVQLNSGGAHDVVSVVLRGNYFAPAVAGQSEHVLTSAKVEMRMEGGYYNIAAGSVVVTAANNLGAAPRDYTARFLNVFVQDGAARAYAAALVNATGTGTIIQEGENFASRVGSFP